jgi:2-polyprenyl-3-methyl-5-hydroxy-6-metoxy-1,4-benzoquinol methylase
MPDNEVYWVKRHESLKGSLATVGNIGSQESDNLKNYARKKRFLADLLRDLGKLDLKGATVLDAGCGIGLMSELLFALGADVFGVDISPVAIEEASCRCPSGTFKVSSLLDFNFARTFDLVCCFDVLYHVVDDDNWRVVVENLAAHTSQDGLLLIIDQLKARAHSPAAHVKFRTAMMYTDALTAVGLDHQAAPGHELFLVFRPGG